MENTAEKLKKEIHEINSKIDKFQKRVEDIPVAARDEFKKTLSEIQAKRKHFSDKFHEFIEASENAGDDIKTGAGMMKKDLEDAYLSAKEDLNMTYNSAKERFFNKKAS